ncbi:MAG: TiaS agmantine-binding domain-containing protein [Candidatus Hodarchaeales archaeon]
MGLDDTDSPTGGCTTYLASQLCRHVNANIKFADYPHLVRLNPNVPFKTRGNGAIAIHLEGPVQEIQRFEEEAVSFLAGHLASNDHAQPCLAFVEGQIDPEILKLYKKALSAIVSIDEAVKVAEKSKTRIEAFSEFLGRRGIVGALAAIGWGLSASDYTFELIAYRSPENWKAGRRLIDPESVSEMNSLFSGTFGNVDSLNNEIKIAPHGPDPVLCGIRGDSPEELLKAWRYVKISEPIFDIMLFRSNQGTGVHLEKQSSIANVQSYESVVVRGTVMDFPCRKIGGHLFFRLQDGTDEIQCAAYEPTRQFRDIVEQLWPGDDILALGGIRPPTEEHPVTLNLEKIKLNILQKRSRTNNPTCPSCGKRLKSAGKQKGFKCFRCSRRFADLDLEQIPIAASGHLKEGEWIQPPTRAWRHLTKPPSRSKQQRKWIPDPDKIDHWIKHERASFLKIHINNGFHD